MRHTRKGIGGSNPALSARNIETGRVLERLRPPAQPVLNRQASDLAELALVVGDEGTAERNSVGGDQQIVGAHGSALAFKGGTNLSVDFVGRRREGQDLQDAESLRNPGRQAPRAPLLGAEPQLGRHDDAGADACRAHLADAICHRAAGMSHEV